MGQCVNVENRDVKSDGVSTTQRPPKKKKVEQNKEWWDTVREHVTAGDIEYVKHLINVADLDVFDVDYENYTLLVWAARKGQYDICQLALNLGADIHYVQKDPNGDTQKDRTALQWADACGWLHVEQLLVFTIMNASTGAEVQRYAQLIDQQNGIVANFIGQLDDNAASTAAVKESLVNNMVSTIRSKLVFSDDMLRLAWTFEATKDGGGAHSLEDNKVWNAILETCSEVIQAKPANEKDWHWIKHFMLPSTIWLIDISEEQKSEEKESDAHTTIHYLFDELLKVVELASQTLIENDLVRPMNRITSNSREAWQRLQTWDLDGAAAAETNTTAATDGVGGELNTPLLTRQDYIDSGVKSEFSKTEISQNIVTPDFNAIHHYDYNEYLSKLVFNAHAVNDQFQHDVQRMFGIDKVNKTNNAEGDNLIEFRRGPVKLTARCIDKAQTDYRTLPFPTSAHLLDINRCSLIFRDDGAMLNALELFRRQVEQHDAGCILKIARAKNGFVEYAKTPQYADIKLNVVIRGKNGTSIIGEIQFLLDIMMHFKNDAHKLYAISRKKEVFDAMKQTLPKLLDHTKQLYFAAGIGNIDYIFDLMIIHNKTEEFVLQIMEGSNENIFHTICALGNLKLIKKLRSYCYRTPASKQKFIESLFVPNRYTEMCMEACIRRGHGQAMRFLFTDKAIIDHIKGSEDLTWRMVLSAFSCDSDEDGPFILEALGVSEDDIRDKWADFKSTLRTDKLNIVWCTKKPVRDMNKKRQWDEIGRILGEEKRQKLHDEAAAVKWEY
eukprot:CAMPEP_0202694684 /NCGR_PEP_ID=MMETSP1385-20130828/8479_1 /ASSEMBLY_ACC=CAM_ASM_000861 /TAXON_ID=933848 /ORGANISM="Elphidium margaritaceum" /LENGTH=781 /DNA_ID=CAMNT_0049350577 /DNA_START=32 /DNA_END=2377 /DNA_ORIENTATION=+